MKYCPGCGNQLVDEAKFCTACGAKQPAREKEALKEEKTEPIAPIEKEQEALNLGEQEKEKNVLENMTDREKYDYLMKNDEAFSSIVKAARKKDHLSMVNLLYVVIWLLCSFIPILTFTGVGMTTMGAQELAAMGKSTPLPISGLEVWTYNQIAGNYALSPSSSLTGIYPFITFLFGFVFLALIVLVATLGFTRGFALRTYLKGGSKELVKNLGGSKNFIGIVLCLFPIMGMVTTFVQASDLDYSKGDNYIFGQIETIPGNLIAAIAVSLVLMVGMLIVAIIATARFKAKVKAFIQ